MNETRKKLLERIKAILAKTMANGCTEGEAMAALAKARELMATYEIDEKELSQLEQEQPKIFKSDPKDPYQIKFWMAKFVGKFTRCRAWAGNDKIVSFAGLESDVIFASWLLDTLQQFVMRELRNYQKSRAVRGAANNNLTSSSFVSGCTMRICEKLKELTPVEETKNALVEAFMEKNGIVLRERRASQRDFHDGSLKAGFAAGNNARFDKPVSQGGAKLLK